MKEKFVEAYKKANKDYYDYLESIDQKGLVDTEGKASFIVDRLLEKGAFIPPCKVGDTVYILTTDSPTGIEESRVKRMVLENLQDGVTVKVVVPCVYDDWGKSVWQFYPEDFGVKVFLSKEQAEQKQKEEKDGVQNGCK